MLASRQQIYCPIMSAPSRIVMAALLSFAAGFQPLQVIAQQPAAAHGRLEEGTPSNPEMKRIFQEDQAVRQNVTGIPANGAGIAKSDAVRRQQTMHLLTEGALHSAVDFNEAAFVFQHGSTPDDYLLAHTLAMVAVSKGDASALWIASATLDRYLHATKQPQIYGTQFFTRADQPTTQEPFNRTLISDALRKQLGVPSLAEQDKQRESFDKEFHPAK